MSAKQCGAHSKQTVNKMLKRQLKLSDSVARKLSPTQ